MTLGFGALTIGLMFLYSAFTNTSVAELLTGKGGTGKGEDRNPFDDLMVGATSAGISSAATALKAGGGWGGAKGVVDSVTAGTGLTVSSAKRDTQSTSSGGVSDHWTGCKECYAKDLSGSVSAMDRAAIVIAKRLGTKYDGKSALELTKEVRGYRVQVLYRTMTGGDHFTHIHVGARKNGYMP